jgi:phage terminase large subunit-like protein
VRDNTVLSVIEKLPAQYAEALKGLPPEQLAGLWTMAQHFGPAIADNYELPDLEGRKDVVDFMESKFYLPDTRRPIKLLPFQRVILRYMFWAGHELPFQTYIWSTVKKSGKTTIAAGVARWVAETFGPYQEVYCIANDQEQARGRSYEMITRSINSTPGWDERNKALPGLWRVIERQLLHLPSGSVIKALSGDYRGEAGANPTASFWTELWGYTKEASLRLYDEMTPVPTRPHSFRFIETYAGFINESELLQTVWDAAIKKGRRVTQAELVEACGEGWPYEDDVARGEIPIYINEINRICAYIDIGERARRMPWQTPVYYASQAADLRPNAFDRLHLNMWVSTESDFLPQEWWNACYDPEIIAVDARTGAMLWPFTGKEQPMVVAVDAAVSGDCCAVVGVTRDPRAPDTRMVVRFAQKWDAPERGKFNYGETIEPTLRWLCANCNVVQIAYDAYQLHDMSTRLGRTEEQIAWWKEFSQGADRMEADKQLYDYIRDRRLLYGFAEIGQLVGEHLANANGKSATDQETKLRMVKKSKAKHIDLAVALSMAAYECRRLNL